MKRAIPLTMEQALSRAAGLCAKCEQCTPDIHRKLSMWGISTQDADKIIRKLEQLRFVDDSRFIRAYAHDKLMYSGWGRNKIITGLWAKRLPRNLIDRCMDEISNEDYESVASKVIKAKIRISGEDITSYEGKIKVLRHAMQRGFESKLALRIINCIAENPDNEDDWQ